MDKQEFCRRAYADPSDQSPEYLQAVDQDEGNAALSDELKELNEKLTSVLEVDVPEGLADKLKRIPSEPPAQEPTSDVTDNVVRPSFAPWRIAASVAVAVGLTFGLWQFTGTGTGGTNLVNHALEHTRHGFSFAGVTNNNVSLQSVNAKLANFGGVLTEQIGEIYWASHCDFEGVKSLHLVLGGEKGRINLYLVPNDRQFQMKDRFADQQLEGQISPSDKGHVVIVGEIGEPLDKVRNKVNNSLHWKA